MLRKKCSGCQSEKEIVNFYKNKRKKDGYQNYCKSCTKASNATSFQAHKKERMAKSSERQRSEKGIAYRFEYYKHGSKRKREVAKQDVAPDVYQQQHVEYRAQYMAATHDERSKVNHKRYERDKPSILAQQNKKKVRVESIEVAPTNQVELVEVVPTKKTLHDFVCEREPERCVMEEGICIMHKTSNGKRKVDCLVNHEDGQLARGSDSKVVFHCDVCQHDFSSSIGHVTNRRWCGMCSLKWKHCCDKSCKFCHEKSFASYLGMTSNGKRKVKCLVNAQDARLSMSSNKKVFFRCDTCEHTFKTSLRAIVCTNRWCNMCSSKWKHCNVDTCLHCYNRSFISYYGVTTNGKRKVDCLENPEDAKLPKGSNIKCNFQCDVCEQNFEMDFNHITNRKRSWCSHCKNKTELKVFIFLTKELKLQVKREYIPSFQWRDYKKRRRFDFLLVDFDIIFEIDGPQHTEEVPQEWIRSTLLHRQIVDKWKEFLARRDGKRVFRFNQHTIWMDSYDWKAEMRTLVNNI